MSDSNSDSNAVFVGFDVAKDFIDVCLLQGERKRLWRVRQTAAELAKLARKLAKLKPQLLVAQATGGDERELADACRRLELPLVVKNPKQIRDFAKSRGILAKTDRVDAYVTALYGQLMRPELRELASREQRELADQSAYRQSVVKDRAALKVRLQRASDEGIRASIARRISHAAEEIKQVEATIKKLIAGNEQWCSRAKLASTVPGIAVQVSRVIVADAAELGRINDKQAAALVGVAPYADDSGKSHGRRRIRGGRSRLRRMFYMAARTAVRVDAGLREFYQGLVARGKPKQLALIAVARKLVVIVNHMFRDNRPYLAQPSSVS